MPDVFVLAVFIAVAIVSFFWATDGQQPTGKVSLGPSISTQPVEVSLTNEKISPWVARKALKDWRNGTRSEQTIGTVSRYITQTGCEEVKNAGRAKKGN